MIVIIGLGTLGTRVCKRLPQEKRLRHGHDLLLIDYDVVNDENVDTQYPREFVGRHKVDAAREAWQPEASVLHKHIDVTTVGVLKDAHVVIDCTDNLLVRRVINDYCSKNGIPWVHTAISDSAGTAALFVPGSACFNCVYPGNVGETCTRDFNRLIAEHVAATAVFKAFKADEARGSSFVRVTAEGSVPMTLERRPTCAACSGEYEYLDLPPKHFYITYCANAGCMAAKPLNHLHDHGTPVEKVVRGIPLEVFPNGEIHFHKEADDDLLYAIAYEVYGSRLR